MLHSVAAFHCNRQLNSSTGHRIATGGTPHWVLPLWFYLGLTSLDPHSMMRAGSFATSSSGYLPAIKPLGEALDPLADLLGLQQLQK